MPSGCCCVPGCSRRGGHTFPEDEERRKSWMHAVRRGIESIVDEETSELKKKKFAPTKHSIVCHGHFVESDYHNKKLTVDGLKRTRQNLKKTAVPSVFKWSKEKTAAQLSREERHQKKEENRKRKAAEEWEQRTEELDRKRVYTDLDLSYCEEICVSTDSLISSDCSESVEIVSTCSLPENSGNECSESVEIVSTCSLPENSGNECSESVEIVSTCSLPENSGNECSESVEIVTTCSDSLILPDCSESVEIVSTCSLPENSGNECSDQATPTQTPSAGCSSSSSYFFTVESNEAEDESEQPDSDTERTKGQPYLSVEAIKHDNKLVHHYTGLETIYIFMHAFWSLGDAVDHLIYTYSSGCTALTPVNQFLLMLVKLRRYYPHFELGRMFGVSRFVVQKVFTTWVNFCYFQWREVDWWPKRQMVSHHCPVDFKRKFPSTRVIVDATEVRVKRPSNPKAQRISFSSYKHSNTVKVLVGVTPGGLTSFVSDAYGGSSSDRQIVERSALTTLCDPHDSIMADKGFNVQDIFALRDVHINIPAFFKQKNRLSPTTRADDRKIASKRVHVERVIGMAKVYAICQQKLNLLETKLATQIISVCFFLCNFRKTIIGRFA
ncbi:hypothetical protein V1264_017993 [Littorina saxatilis]|uniref:THAP-type domain-containing protein n=1 Tax=Littorina saxatilis TaxID=31220 RepID=A0AAN9GHB7_9CAEN